MAALVLDCGHTVMLKRGIIVQGIMCRQCNPPHFDKGSYEVGRSNNLNNSVQGEHMDLVKGDTKPQGEKLSVALLCRTVGQLTMVSYMTRDEIVKAMFRPEANPSHLVCVNELGEQVDTYIDSCKPTESEVAVLSITGFSKRLVQPAGNRNDR